MGWDGMGLNGTGEDGMGFDGITCAMYSASWPLSMACACEVASMKEKRLLMPSTMRGRRRGPAKRAMRKGRTWGHAGRVTRLGSD